MPSPGFELGVKLLQTARPTGLAQHSMRKAQTKVLFHTKDIHQSALHFALEYQKVSDRHTDRQTDTAVLM
jgi:hypothetical protein